MGILSSYYLERFPMDFFDTKEPLVVINEIDRVILRKMRKLVSEGVLNKKEGEILTLKAFGYKEYEIAAFVSISESGVTKSTRAGTRKLRQYLGLSDKKTGINALTEIIVIWGKDLASNS
jgi:DNA-binding CsgD family transcriptional regulator